MMATTTKQANFLLPEDVLDELKKTVSGRQQSKVVAEALRKELKRLKLEKVIHSSFGVRDHIPCLGKTTSKPAVFPPCRRARTGL